LLFLRGIIWCPKIKEVDKPQAACQAVIPIEFEDFPEAKNISPMAVKDLYKTM